MDVIPFFHSDTSTVTYLVVDDESGAAILIDPVLDFDATTGRVWRQAADEVLAVIAVRGLRLEWILETHIHADHLSAAQIIKSVTGARVAIGARTDEVQGTFGPRFFGHLPITGPDVFDRLLEDDEIIAVGALRINALHTPGHTPACMTYAIGDALFVGDTLFMPDFGTARTDFPGGDAATLYQSIRRILSWPAATRIFVGHDYKAPGRDRFAWESTVEDQRRANNHVREGVTEEQFVQMRRARDATLRPPHLLLPSLQVNIRAGHLPPPDPDGRSRMRIPLAEEL